MTYRGSFRSLGLVCSFATTWNVPDSVPRHQPHTPYHTERKTHVDITIRVNRRHKGKLVPIDQVECVCVVLDKGGHEEVVREVEDCCGGYPL